jgi:hypothetical protein
VPGRRGDDAAPRSSITLIDEVAAPATQRWLRATVSAAWLRRRIELDPGARASSRSLATSRENAECCASSRRDLDDEKSKRNQQIKELQKEIDTHDRELDTEQQDRVVLCDEIFRAGTVYVLRTGTGEEFEPRPATAQATQRYLPAVETTLHTLPTDRGAAPLLDQVAAAQAHVAPDDAPEAGEDDGVPPELDGDADEDDGLSDPPADETPAQP